MQQFKKLRDRHRSKTAIHLNTVVMAETEYELESFINLYSPLVDSMHFSLLGNQAGSYELFDQSSIKSVTNNENTILKVDLSNNEHVEDIINMLEKQIAEATKPHIITRLEGRLARLKAKVAIVKVGANSEVELKEKRDRVEDAICATKAAIKEGIVPGGGIALLNAASSVTPKSVSEQVLLDAIVAPYKTILENAGIEDYEVPKVKGRGLNVVTGKTVNMVKSGIIDPLLVTKSALQNAASVATTILSTDCVINNLRA